MFGWIKRLYKRYEKFTLEQYDLPKPTVYVLGKKKFIKVKTLRTKDNSKK